MKHQTVSQASCRLKRRQLVSLKLVFRSTLLRGFQNSWLPYLEYAFRSLNAEGLQACKRLKFYKETYEDVVAGKIIPFNLVNRRRGYRPLKPIIKARMAFSNMLLRHGVQRERYNTMLAEFDRSMLSVLRIYELYKCSKKELDCSLEDFKADYLIPVSAEEYSDLTEYLRTAQRWYNQECSELVDRGFPLSEFRKFLDKQADFLRDLARKHAAAPELSATFLSKSSPHKIALSGSKRKSLPSLCMADYDNAYMLRSNSCLKELVERIGNCYIKDVYRRDLSVQFSIDDPVKDGLDDNYVLQYLRDHGIGENVFTTVALANDGGKARIITKAPYALQYALSPLSDTLFGILRSIKTDFTKSHDSGFAYLSRRLKDQKLTSRIQVFCEDQTAATDNFPAVVQAMVLEKLFGTQLAILWYMVMRLPTCIQTSSGEMHDESLLRFKKGQPMGVKTSWPAFALTYHVITCFVADLVSTEPVNLQDLWQSNTAQRGDFDYIQVGDDRVYFWNKRDMQKHIQIEQSLGLVVNETKSKVFDIRDIANASGYGSAEFVKRTYTADLGETGGLKPKSFANTNVYGQLHSTVRLLRQRGVNFDTEKFFKELTQVRNNFSTKYSVKALDRMIRIPMCMGGLAVDATSCSTRLLVNASYEALSSTVKRVYGWKYRSFISDSDESDIDDVARAFPDKDHKILDPMKTIVQRYLASRSDDKAYYLTHVRPLVQRVIAGYEDMLSSMQPASLDEYYESLVAKNDFTEMFESTLRAISEISDVPFWMAQKKDRFIANDVIHRVARCDLVTSDELMLKIDKALLTEPEVYHSAKIPRYYSDLFQDPVLPESDTPFSITPTVITSDVPGTQIDKSPEDMTDAELVRERGVLLEQLKNPGLSTTDRLSIQKRIQVIGNLLTHLLDAN